MITIEPLGALQALRAFVTDQKVHPILVNFTAALLPVSVGADIVARILKVESIRATAWWTMLLAACITPFTAIAGWLFWMKDDVGVPGMTIHKWLGTSLAVVLIALVLWRWRIYRKSRWPSLLYLCAGVLAVAALVYQGHLGGQQSFGDMAAATPAHVARPIVTAALNGAGPRNAGILESGFWILDRKSSSPPACAIQNPPSKIQNEQPSMRSPWLNGAAWIAPV